MNEIVEILFDNMQGLDVFIIICAFLNLCIFSYVLYNVNRVYNNFNRRHHDENFDGSICETNESTTVIDCRKLTNQELLGLREIINRWYAIYINITTMFPLMGMLGTVVSLIPMVNSIGTTDTRLFFAALTSTFWGIVAALICKGLDSLISYKIDDNEKRMEYLFKVKK